MSNKKTEYWDNVKEGFESSMIDALDGVVGPENEAAVRQFAAESAARATAAMALGDDALLAEIQAQAKVMAEEQGVRINAAKWDVFAAAIGGVFIASSYIADLAVPED